MTVFNTAYSIHCVLYWMMQSDCIVVIDGSFFIVPFVRQSTLTHFAHTAICSLIESTINATFFCQFVEANRNLIRQFSDAGVSFAEHTCVYAPVQSMQSIWSGKVSFMLGGQFGLVDSSFRHLPLLKRFESNQVHLVDLIGKLNSAKAKD